VKSPEVLTELFRDGGRKVTPQRRAVFEVLHEHPAHPSAEAVHDAVTRAMPTVSLRTVYQTLHDLADMGELAELELGTGATRFDPNLEPHHHLVCDRCGKVEDVYADFADVEVPPSDGRGYLVSSTEIVFRGTCPACRGASGGGPSAP
jgi:Fe2+ or Zn2+ uptake regulation protein